MTTEVQRQISFFKIDKKNRVVYGVVYEPRKLDSDKDFSDEDEISKACWSFMLQSQALKEMHKINLDKSQAAVVENYLAPVDFEFAIDEDTVEKVSKGTWIIGVKIFSDDVWQKIEKKELNGFSMAGAANSKVVSLRDTGLE